MQLPVYLLIGHVGAKAVAEAYPSRAAADSAALALCLSVMGEVPGAPPGSLDDALSILAVAGLNVRLTVERRDLDYAAGLYAAQAEQIASGLCEFAFAYCDAEDMAALIGESEGLLPLSLYGRALRAWLRMESMSLTEAMNDVIGASLPTVRALKGLIALDAETRREHCTQAAAEMAKGDS